MKDKRNAYVRVVTINKNGHNFRNLYLDIYVSDDQIISLQVNPTFEKGKTLEKLLFKIDKSLQNGKDNKKD